MCVWCVCVCACVRACVRVCARMRACSATVSRSPLLRGLVPLHNACSYGHLQVTELLIQVSIPRLLLWKPCVRIYAPPLTLQHGANVNESDFWGYTPLHEAAAKNKLEICRLLLEHGAQVDAKTREGQTPYDLLKDKDGDLADLLQGHRALLDAAKKGDLDRVSQRVGHLCEYVRTYVCACAFGGGWPDLCIHNA